ncbi:MAG: hypothetical protein ABI577_18130 [bacterium]
MRRQFLLASVVATALLFGACRGSGEAKSTPTPGAESTATAQSTNSAGATATKAGTSATAAATATSGTATTKVSANNASQAELQAAFTAAGITGAAQWAREVEEYRPYATSDTNLAKLRQNLVKYNPGPGVVDAIVAALSLP